MKKRLVVPLEDWDVAGGSEEPEAGRCGDKQRTR